VHGLAISAVSAAVALHASAPEPRDLVPIEVVRAEPPPPPPPEKPKPPRREKIVQPKLVTAPATQPVEPPAPPTPALMSDVPRRQPADAPEASDASRRMLAGAAASSNWTLPRGAGVPGAGSDKLFSTGDIPRPAGGGSGSGGRQVASTGNPTDLTSFARPLGGYQTRPRYPDSARRQGIEGETVLRFQVLTNGRVASLTVAHSAGHSDLDRAAMDAVKTWVFEPARRGEEAVVVWVTLPVRFQLQNGLGD
jgi:protein TonB